MLCGTGRASGSCSHPRAEPREERERGTYRSSRSTDDSSASSTASTSTPRLGFHRTPGGSSDGSGSAPGGSGRRKHRWRVVCWAERAGRGRQARLGARARRGSRENKERATHPYPALRVDGALQRRVPRDEALGLGQAHEGGAVHGEERARRRRRVLAEERRWRGCGCRGGRRCGREAVRDAARRELALEVEERDAVTVRASITSISCARKKSVRERRKTESDDAHALAPQAEHRLAPDLVAQVGALPHALALSCPSSLRSSRTRTRARRSLSPPEPPNLAHLEERIHAVARLARAHKRRAQALVE